MPEAFWREGTRAASFRRQHGGASRDMRGGTCAWLRRNGSSPSVHWLRPGRRARGAVRHLRLLRRISHERTLAEVVREVPCRRVLKLARDVPDQQHALAIFDGGCRGAGTPLGEETFQAVGELKGGVPGGVPASAARTRPRGSLPVRAGAGARVRVCPRTSPMIINCLENASGRRSTSPVFAVTITPATQSTKLCPNGP